MANFGIDIANRMSMNGGAGGIDVTRVREATDNLVTETGEGKGASFGEFLQNMVQEANVAQITADRKLEEVAAGRSKDLHGAVLSMEKADVQFRLLTQVRNKVIEAYREIMRMQV